MKNILENIKKGGRGVVGSFLIENNRGNVIISDMPELLNEEIKRVSLTLSLLSCRVRRPKSIEKIQILAEEGNIIAACNNKYILACITSRDANVGFIHILLRRSLEALSLETGE